MEHDDRFLHFPMFDRGHPEGEQDYAAGQAELERPSEALEFRIRRRIPRVEDALDQLAFGAQGWREQERNQSGP